MGNTSTTSEEVQNAADTAWLDWRDSGEEDGLRFAIKAAQDYGVPVAEVLRGMGLTEHTTKKAPKTTHTARLYRSGPLVLTPAPETAQRALGRYPTDPEQAVPYVYLTHIDDLVAHLPAILTQPVIAFDTETTGLDSNLDRLRLLTLSVHTTTLVIDTWRVQGWQNRVRPLFADRSKTLVAQTAMFDLGFLLAAGIACDAQVFDTEIASRLIDGSLNMGRKGFHALASIAKRYLNLTLDKSEQVSDWRRPSLTEDQLKYAALDAAVLLPLQQALSEHIQNCDLQRVMNIEMRALPAIVSMTYNGMPFDAQAWGQVADQAAREEQRFYQQTMAYFNKYGANTFGGFPLSLESTKQLLHAFHRIGVNVPDTNENTLSAYRTNPVVKSLLDWRDAFKRSTTYGKNYITDNVRAKTGRIHPQFRQIGAATGRMSSVKPNIQQVPRRDDYRACFRPKTGRAFVKVDFSGIELRLAAIIAPDQTMIQAFREGRDLHKATATMVLGVPEDRVTKQHRQVAKSCFSGDTEILTLNGWVRFDQYDGKAQVAQYSLPEGIKINPSRGRSNRWGKPTGCEPAWDGSGGIVTFVPPVDFQSFEDQQVYSHSDRNSDLLLTGNHNVLWIDAYGHVRKCTALDVPSYARELIVSGHLTKEPKLSEALTRVLAMVVADGSFVAQSAIRLGFTKKHKIDRCRELLQAADIVYRETSGVMNDNKDAGFFYISNPSLVQLFFGFVSSKKDLSWRCLTDIDGKVYLDEAVYWDGFRLPTARNGQRILFSSTRKQTIDVMQSMAITSGIHAVIQPSVKSATDKHAAIYVLSYRLGGKETIRPSWHLIIVRNPMTVYCVQVLSGFIFVRRNGKVVIISNCNFGLLYGMGPNRLVQYGATAFNLDLTEDEATTLRDKFFEVYKGLQKWHWSIPKDPMDTYTLTGRVWRRVGTFTQRANTPVQGSSSDGIKLALGLLWEHRHEVPSDVQLIAVVHDEIDVECTSADAPKVSEWVRKYMLEAMNEIVNNSIPIEVEATIGRDWAGTELSAPLSTPSAVAPDPVVSTTITRRVKKKKGLPPGVTQPALWDQDASDMEIA